MAEELKTLLDKLEKRYMEKFDAMAANSQASHEDLQKKASEDIAAIRAKMDEQEKRITALTTERSLPGSEAEPFSFHKATRAIYTGDWAECGVEKEVFDNMKKKAATAGDGSSGGYLVPLELANKIVEPAIASMPVYGLGITTISNVRGNFELPVMESRPEGVAASENGALTEVDLTWGERLMVPHRNGAYTKVSKRLIMQTGGVAETFVTQQLQKSVSLGIHKSLIQGSGSDNQVKGVLNYSGFTTNSTPASGQYTIKHMRTMMTDLQEVDFDLEGGSFGFLLRPIIVDGVTAHRTTMYSGQTSGKGFVFTPPVLGRAGLEERIDAKVATTTHIPISGTGNTATATVIYGDWSHFVLVLWAGLQLDATTQASDSSGNSAWLKNQVWIKAEQEYDCCVDLPAAFIKDTTAIAARGGWSEF